MMTRVRLLSFAVALLAAAPLTAQELTLDQVLEKHYQASGGLEKLHAIKSMRMTGRMILGQGIEAPFTRTTKRPDLVRMDFTIQGLTGIQAYDGANAWTLMPFMGQTEPELMPPDAAASMKEDADFDGPLVDYQRKGIKIQLMGKDKVEGTDAYKLMATMKSGEVTYFYLDAEYFLALRMEGKRTVQGQEFNTVTTLGDYKDVDGLMIPHSVTVSGQGPTPQQLIIEKVELNVDLPDSTFKMPAKSGL